MSDQPREYIAPHISDDLEATRDLSRARIVGDHPEDPAYVLVAFRDGLTTALPKQDSEMMLGRVADIHEEVTRQCRALGITLAVE
jgi:hypothetical protein